MSSRANTQNFSIHMDEGLFNRMETTRAITDNPSRSEYVTSAVKFYGMYHAIDCDPILFSKIIIGDMIQNRMSYPIHLLKREWEKLVEQMEHVQLDIAHELAKLSHIMGDNLNLSKEQMEHLYIKAINETQTHNTVYGFENRLED